MSEQDRSGKAEGQVAAPQPQAESSNANYALALRRKIQKRAAQRKLDSEQPGGAAGAAAVHAAAEHGTSGPGGALPHLDTIQKSFGKHDVSGVNAHTGGAANEAASAMGAQAFATGNDVAFAGAPSLHTAAHEAAHVVQQRAGVHLKGGVGEEGDAHERHADAVADKVVAGESAEGLLDAHAGGGGATPAVQHKLGAHLDLPPNVGKVKAAVATYQSRYDASNPTQNVALLEAVKAACDSTGKSYQMYLDDLRAELTKELTAERQRAQTAPPKSGAPTTPVASHDHAPVKPPETATGPKTETATGPKTETAPVGPKPAVGDVHGFEQALGLEALKHAGAQGSVNGLMTKVMHTLTVRAQMIDKVEHEVEAKKTTVDALISEFTGTTANTVAGAVGQNADVLRATMAHATGGTIREKMTVFFNFAGKFQDYILGSGDTEREAFLSKANINVEAIRTRVAKLKHDGEATNPDGSFQKVDKRNSGRKSFPPLQDAEGAEHQQGEARDRRGKEPPAKGNPTVGQLGATKETALSQAELDMMFPEKKVDGHVSAEAVKNEAVTWNLGVNQWKEKEGSKFVADLKALNLPFGAGPSGTTARIFSTAEYLGEPKDHLLRMACIGYLVPIHAHSLLEVVAGAATHGVPAPKFEEHGADVYERITPFDAARVKALKLQFKLEEPPK